MLIAFVPPTIVKLMHIEISIPAKELFKTCSVNAFILGLFFIAWSIIITPIVDFLFKIDNDLTAQSVVFLMVLEYLIMYYLQKQGR